MKKEPVLWLCAIALAGSITTTSSLPRDQCDTENTEYSEACPNNTEDKLAQSQTCTTNCTDFPKGYHQCITRCR